MTTFRKTIEAYKKGQKETAFEYFKNDPTANKDVTFEKFCDFMEKTIGSVQSVCPTTGKVERA